VEKSSLFGAEVRDTKTGRRHVVNTDLHECSCNEWQHTGKPCEHAILFLASKPRLNMHPYLHEYYSVQKFKAAYANPIPPLTDQSQWPEVDIHFTLSPPLMRRKAGWPQQSRFRAWFEKGGSRKKGKNMKRIMANQKGHKKVIKIDARDVKNLVTELDQPNVATLLQSMSLFIQKIHSKGFCLCL
jgi:hypothetical protein